jgi:aryl carrier-like protein
MGLAMIDPEDGFRMLQDLLYANRTPQAAVLPLARARLPQNLPPFYAELTAHHRPSGLAADAKAAAPQAADLLARLATAADGERIGLLSTFLAAQVVKVLALGASYKLDRRRSLLDMGMDSLMAMELRNRIQSSLKMRVAIADLLKGPSVEDLSRQLLAASEPAAFVDAATDTWEEGSL